MALLGIGRATVGFMREKTEDFSVQITVFSIFAIIAYPLFGFLNKCYFLHAGYDSFSLRVVIGLVFLAALLRKFWPQRLQWIFPIYWYAALVLGLPFFFIFMLLQNNFSGIWLLNNLTVVFFTIMVIDWLSAASIYLIGACLAVAVYFFIFADKFYFVLGKVHYSDFFGAFLVTLVLGILFSRGKDLVIRTKKQFLRSLTESIAHELRTPLGSIRLYSYSIRDYLPELIESYSKNNSSADLTKKQLELLRDAPASIDREIDSSFLFIDQLLVNATFPTGKQHFGVCSIRECVLQALDRYPFQEGQLQMIAFAEDRDFEFYGDQILVIHILFNLLKNSIYYVEHARKGGIEVAVEGGEQWNYLRFKDTGQGIQPDVLPHIFDRFYSETPHGTGVGLAYCKMAMESMKGDIECQSVFGEYTEFLLKFPKQ